MTEREHQLVRSAVEEVLKTWTPPLTEERLKDICEEVSEKVAEKVIVKMFGELGLPIHSEDAKQKTRERIAGVLRMHSTAENFARHVVTAIASGLGALLLGALVYLKGWGNTPPGH